MTTMSRRTAVMWKLEIWEAKERNGARTSMPRPIQGAETLLLFQWMWIPGQSILAAQTSNPRSRMSSSTASFIDGGSTIFELFSAKPGRISVSTSTVSSSIYSTSVLTVVHANIDLRQLLLMSLNMTGKKKPTIPMSTIQHQLDRTKPSIGVDVRGRLLWVYIPHWLPDDLHVRRSHIRLMQFPNKILQDAYLHVAMRLAQGGALEDCEKRKQTAKAARASAASRKAAKTDKPPTTSAKPKRAAPKPSYYIHREECRAPFSKACLCPVGSLHIGMWTQTGHPVSIFSVGINIIPDERSSFKTNRKLEPTVNLIRSATLKARAAADAYLEESMLFNRMVNYTVAAFDPWLADTLMDSVGVARKLNTQIDDTFKRYTSMFHGFATMFGKKSESHRDKNSDPRLMDVLCVLGKYTNGALRLEELGLRVPYQATDFFLFRGGLFKHWVEDFQAALRICHAYFAHRATLTHLNMTIPRPRKLAIVDRSTWTATWDNSRFQGKAEAWYQEVKNDACECKIALIISFADPLH